MKTHKLTLMLSIEYYAIRRVFFHTCNSENDFMVCVLHVVHLESVVLHIYFETDHGNQGHIVLIKVR